MSSGSSAILVLANNLET